MSKENSPSRALLVMKNVARGTAVLGGGLILADTARGVKSVTNNKPEAQKEVVINLNGLIFLAAGIIGAAAIQEKINERKQK